jgi:hypothetical protein
MSNMTVEQVIIREYQCPVPQVLQRLADEGLTSKQVADRLHCGVSNVRRIARKYKISFNQPIKQSRILQDEQFMAKQINKINFLSRRWEPSIVVSMPLTKKMPVFVEEFA